MQVSEKERNLLLTSTMTEVQGIIQTKIVHPDSKRLFALESVIAAMTSVSFKVKMNVSAKKQALDCMKILIQKFYISRAEMLISISVPSKNYEQLITD